MKLCFRSGSLLVLIRATALQLQPDSMAAICHKSRESRPPSLPPLILFSSLPPGGLCKGSGQSLLTRYQTFWWNLCSHTALQNPYRTKC